MIAQPAGFVTRLLPVLAVAVLVAGCGSSSTRETPSARHGAVSRPASVSVGDRAAEVALAQVGVPYRYGGQSPTGFDCSGLVHYAYGRAGKAVPRTTGSLWSGTTAVERSDILPGDILFFSIEGKMSHVGLYLGGGRFVHAPSSGRSVSVETLSSPFYSQAFLRAGRPR